MKSLMYLIAAVLVCLSPPVRAVKFFFFCSLSNQRNVVFNATVKEDGTYKFTEVSEEGNRRSLLRESDWSFESPGNNNKPQLLNDLFGGDERDSELRALRLAEQSAIKSNNAPGTSSLLHVRSCPCAPKQRTSSAQHFCPAQLDYCAVPGSYYSTEPVQPVCLNVRNDEIFVRSIWPIVLIWFALTLVFCICTWSGRNACDFMLGCVWPSWNRWLFEAVSEPPDDDQERSFWADVLYRRRGFIQDRYRCIIGRARLVEAGGTLRNGEGYEYELRTRIFKRSELEEAEDGAADVPAAAANATEQSDDAESDDDDHRTSCAICFLALEDGDRVGVIDCNHTFHVECLKGWLTRRNVCPLCLQEGLAKPKGQLSLQRRRAAAAQDDEQTGNEGEETGDATSGDRAHEA